MSRPYRKPILTLVCRLCLSVTIASDVLAQTRAVETPATRRMQILPPVNQRTTELVVLAFTSSTCPWAQRDSFRLALDRLVGAVRAYSSTRPSAVRTILAGASIDDDPEVGLRALRRLGLFDELTVGRGWLNPQVIRFGFRDHKYALGTPGVVVYQRDVTPKNATIDISADSVLDRGNGADGILALLRRVEARSGAFAPSPPVGRGRQ